VVWGASAPGSLVACQPLKSAIVGAGAIGSVHARLGSAEMAPRKFIARATRTRGPMKLGRLEALEVPPYGANNPERAVSHRAR
jgi:hypothetical protein